MPSDKPLTAASDNVLMWRLGEACRVAADAPAGDMIDRGLILLRLLNEKGFDVVRRTPGVPEAPALAPHNVDDVMQLVFKYGAARVDVDRSNSAANQRACNEAIDTIRAYLRTAGVDLRDGAKHG